MPTSRNPKKVEFTDEFKRNVRILSKRYRHIRSDLDEVTELLEAGEVVGDHVPGVGFSVFKVRVRNRDIQRGKSSGYHLLYYLKTQQTIVLLTVYSKSDQSDISIAELRRIIKLFESQRKVV